ncbi:hypothetical protein Anas_08908 [Armadillidium nasatum]|uniref:Uncharacterized protein n=1 Tax=Armadillidium nasatum TaxID=96803 RepID=A0A5N5TMT8_9CRUS|nr:hypothetical protein Anas_08908 [Armadillidium nasatum]
MSNPKVKQLVFIFNL